MKYSSYILIACSVCIFAACEKADYDLDKSIYMPDEQYSTLPAYSEWGYNTFGAFYERKVFIYSDDEVPAKVIRHDGRTRFILKGGLSPMSYNDYYYNGYHYHLHDMSLSFDLPGFEPSDYSDLVQLNDSTYDLTANGMNVTAIIDNDTLQLEIIKGSLQFQRVQHLVVDRQPMKVIMSGYFGFQALVEGEPISMSYGRFDVSIDEYQFANY